MATVTVMARERVTAITTTRVAITHVPHGLDLSPTAPEKPPILGACFGCAVVLGRVEVADITYVSPPNEEAC